MSTKGPVDLFLQNLAYWSYSIPLQTQWIVKIDPVTRNNSQFISNITNNTRLDKNDFTIENNLTDVLLNSKGDPHVLGVFFAQKVALPGENFSLDTANIDGKSGGFLEGYIGGDRESKRDLSIDFLETNLDFLDFVIKPWIITSSYRGLMARSTENSIKCNIYVYQYTKSVRSEHLKDFERPIRKVHQFLDCVPYSVEGKNLDYDSDDIKTYNVKWAFNHYTYKLNDANKLVVL